MIRRASQGSSVVPLTEARSRLFRLVEELLSGRADRVTLSHRGHDEEVLLVRARDVERMEEELVALRQRVAPYPRPLPGMGRIVGAPDDVLIGIRADQHSLADAKLRSIIGVDVSVDDKTRAAGARVRRTQKPESGGA